MPTTTDARLVLACRRVELRMTQGLLVDAWHDNGRWHYRTPTGNGTCTPLQLYAMLAATADVLRCQCGARIRWDDSQWRHLDITRNPHRGEPDSDSWRAAGRRLLS